MKWLFILLLNLQAMAMAEPTIALQSPSWFDKVRYLRFGNEKLLTLADPVLDLSRLKDDEYWYVDGKVWFFPGEFLPPDELLQPGAWEKILAQRKPLLLDANNSWFQNSRNPADVNYGSYVLQVRSPAPRRLAFGAYNVYHPARFYIVDKRKVREIRSFGNPDPDPDRNHQQSVMCCPLNFFDVDTDFFIITHASTPVSDTSKTTNFSGFFIGPETYLFQEMRNTFALIGCLIGCFFLAGTFYGFIYSFRRRDRSSLYLSLFASLAFLLAVQTFVDLPLDPKHIGKLWTFLNLLAMACLQLFILEKIREFIQPKTQRLCITAILGGCLAGQLTSILSLDDISGLIYLILMLGNTVLMGLVVAMGLRHRINGTLFFGAGAAVCSLFQYSIIHISIFKLNEDPGNAVTLANLAMVLALALVNAKDFALTYQASERMRQDLQVLLEEVQEKEQARTLFFQNTSHELRTPLNGIIGFMQLLTQGRYGKIPEAAEVQLQKCIRLAISLKNQVNSILDLAKSKKGRLTLSNSSIAIKDLIDETEDLAAGLLLKRNDFSFQCNCEWQTLLSQFIGDREKIATILRNLVGNAFKFADPVRPNAVALTITRDGGWLHIIVSDTGIGIPIDYQDKIFEEFKQVADDSRRAYEGSGLGLAIVREFVKLMGGDIRLESEQGKGSRFFVSLPEQKEIHLQKPTEIALGHLEPKTRMTPAVAVPSNLPVNAVKGHVLVVDDNEMNCDVLRDVLQHQGFQVSAVLDGQEALRFMRREHPDLLLLDMMMPLFSGEDVIKAMKQDSLLQDIPVILITARASDDDRLFGLGLGADDYLAKPIHHEELLFRVQNLLQRLETRRKMVEAEEGLKPSQLGRLMNDFSHELKNAFQLYSFTSHDIPRACEKILRYLPIPLPEWQEASRLIASERMLLTASTQFSDLSFTDAHQEQSAILRSLRTSLDLVDIHAASRRKIWHLILSLSADQQEECEQVLYIVRNFLVMKNQTTFVMELVENILEYSKGSESPLNASTQAVLDAIIRLVRPRMLRLGIRLDVMGDDCTVTMSQGHMMQVMLNLVSNAMDAVANLGSDQKWIRISVSETEGKAVISCASGGGSARKDSLAFERLIQKAQGSLEINSQSPYPEIVFRIPSIRMQEYKRSG
ncbi:MAG TPA: ATP-binding protein [Oligoflexus sp.]|uniref:ATP-binding protein n=1 Tax=Oligoflexus sp. TaxID=1971216 RepID=UPI002D7E94D4|nr:ATP-binding protein [Oligoflexus sp.]HET9236660.1 ATP-binding protein [Oligoflexus sp.]